MPMVEAWQACALSLEIDPHPTSMASSRHDWKIGPGQGEYGEAARRLRARVREALEKRLDVLTTRIRMKDARFVKPGELVIRPDEHEIELVAFVRWAQELPLTPFPEELVKIAEAQEADAAVEPVSTELAAYVHADAKPLSMRRFCENEILRVVLDLGLDPRRLPSEKIGVEGIRARVKERLVLQGGWTDRTFRRYWESLQAGEHGYLNSREK